MIPYAHHIAVIRRLLRAGAVARAEKVLDKIPPGDLGAVMAQLPELEARPLCQLLLSPGRRQRTLRSVPRAGWGPLFAPLNDPEILKILEGASAARAQEILTVLPPERVARLKARKPAGLVGPADAATVMGEPGICLPVETTAQAAIDAIRERPRASETFYLYVVDATEQLVGVMPLRRLVTAAADTTLAALLTPRPVSVTTDTPAEEAARLLGAHGFLALPVVDGRGHLVGVINADDVFELMTEAASESAPPVAAATAEAPQVEPRRGGSAWSQWFPFLSPRRGRGRPSTKAAFVGVALVMASGSLLSFI